MKCMRRLRFASWTTSAGLFLPFIPGQCGNEWIGDTSPGSAGVAGNSAVPSAGSAGGTASAPETCGSAPEGVAGQSATLGGATGSGGTSTSGSGGATCGNGQLDPGEVCDNGQQNGTNGCDAGCAFVCVGSCPIRVDPTATHDGSGRSWLDPSNQLQSALTTQSTRGGGEVWVRAGDFVVSDVPQDSFVSVPTNVRLRGGFIGTELSPEQRPSGSVTSLIGSSPGATNPLLRIEGATDVVVERIHLSGGEPPFRISNSQRVLLRELSVTPNEESWSNDTLTVSAGSAVRFEHCDLVSPQNSWGLHITDSDVAFVDSRFDSEGMSSLSPKLYAESGRVLIESSVLLRGVWIGEHAVGLIVDSQLLNTWAAGAALYVVGAAAVAGTDFGPGYGSASLSVPGTALVFDSSFVDIRVTSVHGSFPTTWAIEGAGAVSVSLSTFMAGRCDYAGAPNCPPIQAATIDNSVFDKGQPLTASNCISGGSYYAGRGIGGGYSCTDAGDASLLDQSRRRLLDFAIPFQAEPFRADLSRYADENFWARETARADACGDTGAPDPGRHFPCTP